MTRKLAILLVFCLPAFAAWPPTTQVNIQSTAADDTGGIAFDNGGTSCGTNYSLQDSPQVTYIDIVVGATTTQYTSVLNAVTSALVCNGLHITGGAGCTTGWFIMSSQSGGTATMDRSLGSAASVCAGKLGGAALTGAGAVTAAVSGNPSSGPIFNLKSGTYTVTTPIQYNNSLVGAWWRGYGSTPGDGGTKPLVTSSTNSAILFQSDAGAQHSKVENISFSHTAGTRGVCYDSNISGTVVVFLNDVFDGCQIAIRGDFNVNWNLSGTYVIGTEIKNSVSHGILNSQNGNLYIIDSWIHANGGKGATTGNTGVVWLLNSVFSGNTNEGFDNNPSGTTAAGAWRVSNCAFYSNGGSGFRLETGVTGTNETNTGPMPYLLLQNNVFWNNGAYGVDIPASLEAMFAFVNQTNAYGSNTTAARHNLSAGANDVTLTADPFTSSSVFTLNSAAGGGKLLSKTGYPGATPMGTGFADIGPLQTTGGTGGGQTTSAYSN